MIGTITYILARAGWRSMNGQLTDERRRLAGAEAPAAYVSYDPRLLASVGWYGYRIAFKGGDRQMIERARYMLSERYVIRDGYEYYADGVYVFGVLLRQRVPHYGIGGGAPTPEPDALNFYMPNGGTISLMKRNNPNAVELEYWLDENGRWLIWQPNANGNRSLTLNAGQKIYIRNTSETSTRFGTGQSDVYRFDSDNDLYAHGDIRSLLCKVPNLASLSAYCFCQIFSGCTYLKSAPEFPSTDLREGCYRLAFRNCVNLTTAPLLPASRIKPYAYYVMFNGCTNLNTITTNMLEISKFDGITNWVTNVSSNGDFYCPAELTIPTGGSGIPEGWTRHDI